MAEGTAVQSQEWKQDTLESVSQEDWAVRKAVQEKRRQSSYSEGSVI